MVHIEIIKKDAFRIIGVKTWIPGTDNQAFAEFWQTSQRNGTIDRIKPYRKTTEGITNSDMIGLSCTENDPNVREFFFFICVETDQREPVAHLELHDINAYVWAIFSAEGSDIHALMECEMYAWKEWLPKNGTYCHDNGPEMEVYLSTNRIEYWIPIRKM